jgi:hypothetical protein
MFIGGKAGHPRVEQLLPGDDRPGFLNYAGDLW